MGFTKEELAEMARADAEIEASFRLTPEDLKLQKEMDRFASFDRLDHRGKKVAAQQKAYYEANREKVAAWQKNLPSIRKRNGLSQRSLAKLCGVSQSTVSLWESGKLPASLPVLLPVFPELKEVIV